MCFINNKDPYGYDNKINLLTLQIKDKIIQNRFDEPFNENMLKNFRMQCIYLILLYIL